MITDDQQPITPAAPPRRDQNLPDSGFVFCCFNNAPKIEPGIFGVWMNILVECPGSVGWLSIREPATQANLRREALARGVDASRLVFSTHVNLKADHLARLGCADLFLDTHYYNAHATTADAMWAGLPVLTWPGEAFASRVAASVISAAGLADLVVPDLETYQRTAIHLAHHPEEARKLRARLIAGRGTAPLFDTPRFVKNLEKAYLVMWETCVAGRAVGPIEG
jgi:predicted O-linked N-acetylglucosamine transferase (SPINDLY family)